MLLAIGVMPQMQSYIRVLEKIYINNRTLQDMTEHGRQTLGKSMMEEIKTLKKQLTPFQVKLFSSTTTMAGIY